MSLKLMQDELPTMSEREFCEAAAVCRSTMRYERRPESAFDLEVKGKVREMVKKHPGWGAPLVTQRLKKLGYKVNHKRIEGQWDDECLQAMRKITKSRKKTGAPYQREIEAKAPNHVWTCDFMFERTRHGRTLKIMTLVDEYTREALAVHVDDKINADGVRRVLAKVMETRTAPAHLRTDNGPEFIAEALKGWLRDQGTDLMNVDPGSPWQNGYIESFNGTLRWEVFDREVFGSKTEMQVVLEWWRQTYNRVRPHSSLENNTPEEYAMAASASLQRPSHPRNPCSDN